MIIQNMMNAGLIDHGIFMFALLNTDYTDDEPNNNGIIFGESNIQSFMGSRFDNVCYVPVLNAAEFG